jgi:tRNA-specific 2-thiouridylase
MKKVIVAISGGVDSAVAVALLKRANFDVVGVFMKLADLPIFEEREKKASRVAKILGIPFSVLNLEKEFKKKVVDYFLAEYKKGRTPNPCVVCNKKIKFGLLLEKALELDADYIATGHYARLKREKDGIHLLKGKDIDKDQSYFLWQLNQKQLKKILFPVGNYRKIEVKRLAKKFKLPLLKMPESMEICFIQTTMVAETSSHLPPRPAQRAGQGSVNNFLSRYLKPKTGKIINTKGEVLGEHEGLWFYTIGQRKGIKLPGGPYYVLDKNLKKNILIVTKEEKDLYKKELKTRDINWILGKEPRLPLKIKAKIRYRHKAANATLSQIASRKSRDFYRVVFRKPQRAITPGQSVVFYKGEELFGGGIIC